MNHIKKENCNTLYFFEANDRNVHHFKQSTVSTYRNTVNKTHHLTIKNVCLIVAIEIRRISTNITSL